jgi:hypothetical protein
MLTSLVEREDLRRRSSRYAICAYSKLVYVTLKVKVVAL